MTNSQENSGVSNETLEAFHMMWDSFPHVVMLLKKTRDIVAVNKLATEMGVPTNMRCFQLGGKAEIHEGCKANKAVEEGVAQRMVTYNKDTNKVMDAYWLPVLAEKDVYVHFGIDIDLDHPPPRLVQS